MLYEWSIAKLDNVIIWCFKIAAESKKRSEEPKMDDNADPSAGIMNVSIFIGKVKTSVGGLRLGEIF